MARPRKTLAGKQLDELETLASVLSIEQIADYFGMSKVTFYEIMERQPEVSERYKKGKAKAISEVATGLLMRAKDGDTASAIFYLKTQAGWREKEAEKNDDEAQTLNISFEVKPAAGDVKVTHGKS